jgi:hypothetical protein
MINLINLSLLSNNITDINDNFNISNLAKLNNSPHTQQETKHINSPNTKHINSPNTKHTKSSSKMNNYINISNLSYLNNSKKKTINKYIEYYSN